MTISTRRKNESVWRRLWLALKASPSPHGVCTSEMFQFELAKEISRSNRRPHSREFSLIQLVSADGVAKPKLTPALVGDFGKRIRISDSIGWHQGQLTVLLPETDRDGTMLVANELVRIARQHGMRLDSNVFVYPWDEQLISIADEIAIDGGVPRESAEETLVDASQHDTEVAEETEREDSGHSLLGHHFNGNEHSNGNGHPTGSGHSTGNGVGEPQALAGSNGGHVDRTSAFEDMGDSSLNAMATSVLTLEKRLEAAEEDLPWETSRHLANESLKRATLRNVAGKSIAMATVTRTPLWKRAIDIAGAGGGLIVLSPVLIGAAIAVRVTSRGPVLFRQEREGKDGKTFGILKFRTMVVDAEAQQASLRDVSEQDGPAFKLKNDPRITTVGRYLRKSCVDELPQLVNVLLGQMSLVGPRPLPVGESHACKSWQRIRLTVLPGLTCTWQARGGRDVSFDQWMRMDLDYIDNRSFTNDVKLIFETAYIALMQRGSV